MRFPPQEDARADMVDCVVRDIHNIQCQLNVEYSGASCPHVTIQFGDTKDDVGLGLVKEGLVMVDVRKEKHLQKMVSVACLTLVSPQTERTVNLPFLGGHLQTTPLSS